MSIVPNSALQTRVAFSSNLSITGSSSPGELEMTCRTSEVAVCCSNASVSSSVRARSSFRSRVFFDCNYCLFGEVFHQLDLFVDERMNFLTINGNYADKVLFLKQRYN